MTQTSIYCISCCVDTRVVRFLHIQTFLPTLTIESCSIPIKHNWKRTEFSMIGTFRFSFDDFWDPYSPKMTEDTEKKIITPKMCGIPSNEAVTRWTKMAKMCADIIAQPSSSGSVDVLRWTGNPKNVSVEFKLNSTLKINCTTIFVTFLRFRVFNCNNLFFGTSTAALNGHQQNHQKTWINF